ncbi:g3456 [Coccomyxa viridis]|uniref:G3456 protein n=1 Tax=Coccomyxa viridis TaxID=1274662 RepID=A0ABP1FMU6_9CHLO
MLGKATCIDGSILTFRHTKASFSRAYSTVSQHVSQNRSLHAPTSNATSRVARRHVNLLCLNIPGMVMSLGQPSSRKKAAQLVQTGMRSFRRGDVAASVKEFDEAMRLDPELRPYLWQRGLSLFYAEQYEEAAKQFRDDVAVNPSDTEEAIWAFLSEAKLMGSSKARQQFLQVGRDSRDVMRAAYAAFQEGTSPDGILQAADHRRPSDAFYANLYRGLFLEAENEETESMEAIRTALQTPYAQQSGDYMVAVASVHAKLRGATSVEA